MSCAVIYIKIDSVNEFAVIISAVFTERDFKIDYLFRMCSVATNLVTSRKYNPIRCATTQGHFGRTRNGYVATHFILLSSTAKFLKRFGKHAEAASRNEERTKERPSFVSSSGYKQCNM